MNWKAEVNIPFKRILHDVRHMYTSGEDSPPPPSFGSKVNLIQVYDDAMSISLELSRRLCWGLGIHYLIGMYYHAK